MFGNTTSRRLARAASAWLLYWGVTSFGLTGCGGPANVMEIPEAARKSVFQKKVDVHQRASKPPRSVPRSSADRAGVRP
jgi:hypothetical protein